MKIPKLLRFFLIFFVLLIIVIPVLFVVTGGKMVVYDKVPLSNNLVKPKDDDEIIPVQRMVNEFPHLFVYSLKEKRIMTKGYKNNYDILASPPSKLIAFINVDDDESLYVIAAGDKKARKITNYRVDDLRDWSPDGSKLLFYSDTDDITIRKDGMDASPWEKTEIFSRTSPGFHLYDFNNNSDSLLYPLANTRVNVVKFLDSNRIVVEVNQPKENNKNDTRLVVFNINDFTADYATVNSPVESFGEQRSFSADGKYWTFMEGKPEETNKVIYATFPDRNGIVVDSGGWGDVQKPLLNPSGNYLAYEKRLGYKNGYLIKSTVIWDASVQKVVKTIIGNLGYWISDSSLLIEPNYGDKDYEKYFEIYNVDTQQLEKNQIGN